VARLNLRGAGEGRWLASSVHHTCLTDDLDAAVKHFSAQGRVRGVLAVGFSLGGNLALAAAAAPPAGLRGVASISAPMDLQQTRGMADRFLHGPDEFYDFLKTECVTNSFGLTNSERALICGVLRPHPEVTAAKKFWRARQGQFAASFRH
jgi:pimeloyl-ACP methyl ester carboxylesterase